MERDKLSRKLIAILSLSLLLLGSCTALIPSTDGSDPTGDSPTALHSNATFMKKINDVSLRTQINSNQRLLEHDGTVYYTWAWFNSSVLTLSMIASDDGGSTWTSKLDVWSSSFFEDSTAKELYIWKNEIYLFWVGYHALRHNRQVLMRKAPISSWQDLKTATTVIVRSSEGHNFQIDSDDDYIYMSMVQASQWKVLFYRYNGNSWTNGRDMCDPGAGTQCEIKVVNTGSSSKLLFFYHRQYVSGWSTGYVYLMTSTNNGNSWSSAKIVMDSIRYYGMIDSVNINGTLLFFAGCRGQGYDEIEIIRSMNNGASWSSGKVIISNRGISTTQSSSTDGFAVGLRGRGNIVQLIYEGNPEQIRSIYSKDWGANWIQESNAEVIHSPNSFDPVFASDPHYLSYLVINGSNYDVEIVNVTDMFVDDFAPQGLSSMSGFFSINLSWGPTNLSVFKDHTFQSYNIYRGADPGSLSLYRTLGNVTTFNDTIPSYDPQRYYYAVSASFIELGESFLTNIVSEEYLVPPPPVITGKVEGDFSVSSSWGQIPNEAMYVYPLEYYTVYRGNYPDTLIPVARIYSGQTYNDPDIDRYPSDYYYRVSYTLMVVGESELSNMIMAEPNTLPTPPQHLEFDEIVNGVTLRWEPPMDNGKLPILEYVVYKGKHKDELHEIARVSPNVRNLDQIDLVSGHNYFYTVSAENRLGESEETEPLLVSYKGISSRPESFQVIGKTPSINLSWNTPKVTWGLPISWYYIYRGTAPGITSLYKTVDGTQSTFSDIVDPGIEYYYEISAVNNFGESQRAGPASAMLTGIPGQITYISIEIEDRRISLGWEPVIDDGATPVTHNTIYRSMNVDTPIKIADVPFGIPFFMDKGLVNGQEYYYWITASNINGEGPLSTLVSGRPGNHPFAVSNISIQPIFHGAKLKWDHPMDGGRDVNDYRIYRGESPHSLHYLTNLSAPSLETPIYIDEDLIYGHTYFYCITAVNSIGESSFSAIVSTTPLGAPKAPTIIHAQGYLDEMTVAWIPPEDDGGSPIIKYDLYYREVGSAYWNDIEVDPTILFSSISDLAPGTSIEVMITASNSLAEGERSEIIKVKIGSEPDIIDTISITPRDSGCTISWEHPDINGYGIDIYSIYMVDKSGYLVWISSVDGSVNSYDVESLLNGVEYTFRLSATNILGESAFSEMEIVIPATVPGVVDMVSLEEAGDGFVRISWSEPIFNGGMELIEYHVYRGTSIGTETVIATISADVLEFTDEDVVNGNGYHYLIGAVNILGEGELSDRIFGEPLGFPTPPAEFRSSATSDTVSLSWKVPVNNGGDAIQGFVIYKGKSQSEMKVWKYFGPNEVSASDEDVEKGRYLYRIHAYNSAGMGEGASKEVDVPSRTLPAAMISIFLFIIPLIIVLLIILIPVFIRKNKENKEKKAMEEGEKKKKEAEKAKLVPPFTEPPGLSGPMGMRTLPGTSPKPLSGPAQLPPSTPSRPPESKMAPAQPAQQPPSTTWAPAPVGPPIRTVPTQQGPSPPSINEQPGNAVEPPKPENADKIVKDEGAGFIDISEAKSAIQMLQELNDLKEKGAITEEEYNISKEKLLMKI